MFRSHGILWCFRPACAQVLKTERRTWGKSDLGFLNGWVAWGGVLAVYNPLKKSVVYPWLYWYVLMVWWYGYLSVLKSSQKKELVTKPLGNQCKKNSRLFHQKHSKTVYLESNIKNHCIIVQCTRKNCSWTGWIDQRILGHWTVGTMFQWAGT